MSKLLLVEDDNNLREIYEARLQAEGYSIVTAKDGEEALAVAKSEKPDLIISDVMMPKISGFEMLDILKNTDGLKNVRVIMLTALGQSDDQQRADKLGADRYLVKSQVTLEDIVRVAHELLEDGEETPAPVAAVPTPTPAAVTPAPAPVATPLAVSAPPAPEPTAVPAPAEPVTPAVASPDPVAPPIAPLTSDGSTDQALSASEEEAGIESQIEEFVASASNDANLPEVTPAPAVASPDPVAPPIAEPAIPPVPTAAPTLPPPSDTASAADEKLMDDTVNSLMNETTSTEDAPAGASPAPVSPTSPKMEVSTASGSTMSHEKVIIPPVDREEEEKKPDIQALFAAEQAKETGAATIAPPPVVPAPASPEKPIDPNSIAL